MVRLAGLREAGRARTTALVAELFVIVGEMGFLMAPAVAVSEQSEEQVLAAWRRQMVFVLLFDRWS